MTVEVFSGFRWKTILVSERNCIQQEKLNNSSQQETNTKSSCFEMRVFACSLLNISGLFITKSSYFLKPSLRNLAANIDLILTKELSEVPNLWWRHF